MLQQQTKRHRVDTDDMALPFAPYALAKLARYIPVSEDDRIGLADTLRPHIRTLKCRTVLIDRETRPTELSILLSGWASRSKPLPGGGRQIVAFHLPGDICDIDALDTETTDTVTKALTAVRVAALSREGLAGLYVRMPRAREAVRRESLAAAAIQREWMVNACRRNAQERLAHLLCEIISRLGKVGVRARPGEGYDIPVSQGDLGNACGLTSEHTSRSFALLRRAGLAQLERGRLHVADIEALRSFARFDDAYLRISEPASLESRAMDVQPT